MHWNYQYFETRNFIDGIGFSRLFFFNIQPIDSSVEFYVPLIILETLIIWFKVLTLLATPSLIKMNHTEGTYLPTRRRLMPP